jgi:hypothetical protein
MPNAKKTPMSLRLHHGLKPVSFLAFGPLAFGIFSSHV